MKEAIAENEYRKYCDVDYQIYISYWVACV